MTFSFLKSIQKIISLSFSNKKQEKVQLSQKQTAGRMQLQGYVNAIEAKILDDPAAIQLFASGFTLLTNSFCSE